MRNSQDIQRLDPVQGTYIYSGKKNEVIEIAQKNTGLAEKYARQIFSKVPGLFVYDMDGTGNQVNISTRGLDPHRGWEFNIRKDAVLTNSDMYGYPASHYNIPLEAVERIELVRGTGSLQYGAQFGGLLNYVSKQPDTAKKLSFESINTVGSYGLMSTFNAASGRIKKFRYYVWFNKKWITGYRHNSDSKYDAEGLSLYYDFTKRITVRVEWTHSDYLVHIPGALTDSMFHLDQRMSTRSRNYYEPDIHVPSITLKWDISNNSRIQFISSAVLGSRSSVMFDKAANISDTIVLSTLQYNNRQVDIDNYHSYTNELRFLHTYRLFKQTSAFTAGIQYMNNDLHRRQQGKGTTGTDYDLTLVMPGWGRDLHYRTANLALFAENRWVLGKRFSVTTGLRVETGNTKMTGYTTYYSDTAFPRKISHNFQLLGIGAQYDLSPDMNFYAGWAQSYRPVIFKDIIPQSIYEVTDKHLKDAHGYNAELGFRGKKKFLKWDIAAFYLKYNNRLGTLAQTDGAGNLVIYRTNIGNSRTSGAEIFLQGDFMLGKKIFLSVFTATSYMDARYQNAVLKSGNTNVSVDGNKIEAVPNWISRNGATVKYGIFSLSALYSYTSESFADALNTVQPNASASAGIVPGYQLLDMNIALKFSDKLKLQLNVSNLFDESYFTKRPQFYPGPGIWPSDGRTFSATVSLKM